MRTLGSLWYVQSHASPLADVVTDFTDGLGRTVSAEYESLAQTDAYTLDLEHDPEEGEDYVRRFGGARYVVTAEMHDDGIGGTRDFFHTYDTAFVNTAGRGWQAFRSHTVEDALEETYVRTEYNQAFPTAGMPESVELATLGTDDTIGTGDDGLIRSVDPVPAGTAITGTTPQRQFVRVESTTTEEYEVGGMEDGELLRTILEDPAYNSTYGYVTSTARTVTQPGVTGYWETSTSFDRGVNDIETTDLWCIGLPDTVVTENTLPGGSPVTRTVEHDFNPDCTVASVTDLSDSDPSQQLATSYGYDDYGNVELVTQSSMVPASDERTTSIVFDADGQFPETVTVGGVNLETVLEFDPVLGVKTAVTGPDGLTTTFEYDDFGRPIGEERPGAGSTDVSYHVCASGGCFPQHAAFYTRTDDNTGATSYSFFDAFERPVGSDAPLAGGKRSREEIRYLANGRMDKRSLPYVAGEGVHWVTATYDTLGRTLTEADETGTTATYEYLGHVLEVTDGKSHTTRFEHNALGQIELVIDALGGDTAYTYHPFGELHTVTDDDENVTTILYDARGLKSDLYDPDLGHWQYEHNVFGELAEQTDAKSQTVTLDYDPAGRLEQRVEDEGTTSFTYYPVGCELLVTPELAVRKVRDNSFAIEVDTRAVASSSLNRSASARPALDVSGHRCNRF